MHVTTRNNSNPVRVLSLQMTINVKVVRKMWKLLEIEPTGQKTKQKNKQDQHEQKFSGAELLHAAICWRTEVPSLHCFYGLWNLMQDGNRLRGMYVHVHSPTDDLLHTRIPGTNGTTGVAASQIEFVLHGTALLQFSARSICLFNVSSWPACAAEKNATPTYLL